MSEKKSTIPRPSSQRWRDIRLNYLPILVYLSGIVAIVYLWNTHWMPSTFTGEAQANTANVSSLQAGQLVELDIEQFAHVTRGQVLGRVSVESAEIVKARFAEIRAELEIQRVRTLLDQRRNNNDYYQLRMDQLERKVDLAVAKSRLRFAEAELSRNEKLRDENVASEFDFEVALDNRDTLLTEIRERENLVNEMDEVLTTMQPASSEETEITTSSSFETMLQVLEEQALLVNEVMLIAPIDGVVTDINRNIGENISAGETIVEISSERTNTIIGFIRQPITIEPKVGDTVIIRTRGGNTREAAEAQISNVGARLELFLQPLRVRGFDSSQERGLPVLINIPESLKLYPGELVDIALKI